MTEAPVNEMTPEPDKNNLKKRVFRGSFWTLIGHTLSQVIRLASNLVVTRLLFPEAFGLTALVFTLLAGLEMLSDIGIAPGVIHSKRGDEPKFLNTAWVLSIGRGGVLWLIACVIALPVSRFYNEPLLFYLLPVAGLGAIARGLMSTKWMTANRHVDLKRLTIMEVTAQVAGTIVMILAAWTAKATNASPDIAVWALVSNALVSNVVWLFLSHFYLKGYNNRFEWDSTAFHELQSFGRWIFVSTLFTFFALQGNNLVIPKLLGVSFFGVFSIGSNLSRVANELLNTIGMKVLYPSYAELVRERPERLYPALKRSRMALNGLNWAISLFFIFFGKPLIGFMYDDRYTDAGWILQILAVGSLVSMLGLSYMNVLLAQGKTFILSAMMGVQVVVQFACMFAGYYLGRQYGGDNGGQYGLIVGIATMSWVLYPVQAVWLARLKLWQPEIDLPAIALATGIALLLFLRYI